MARRNEETMMRPPATTLLALAVALAATGCPDDDADRRITTPRAGETVTEIAQRRGLTPDDLRAAAKTYMPTGQHDPYVMFSSGGHSGQVIVIGVPSMRILRVIGVFTPEPWQGWGFGSLASEEVLSAGDMPTHQLRWGDTHHPALSETNGEYDGQWCFVNDKANARVAVIDLRDFETKQIVKNPVAINDHGGTFVTPDTEWVIEGGQYATPLGWEYASIDDYQQKYRGTVTMWKFDRERGRIDVERSFTMELPPYWQDLADAGKLVSDGWIFLNSFNTEMATGATAPGEPPFEVGASQSDMDYLHVINLRKAVEVARAGRTIDVRGMKVIPLETSIEEGLLHFVPEPKSPHGVDVTPGGEFIVVSGKLDPHVTIFSFQKIQEAIARGTADRDPFGVPILPFDQCVEAQVELGLGPLHTQFDDKGYAYTSLFLDSAVARWTLGGPYQERHPEPGWTLVQKLPVHYNIGHLAAVEGDTTTPRGGFLVTLNKWSVDRFVSTGPLLPQNFQLVDIGVPGETMELLYDMPMGIGEPHYAQIIVADKLSPWDVYPEVGWDPLNQAPDPNATRQGEERIVRGDGRVDVYMTVVRSRFTPEHIEVNQGDVVTFHITNVERAKDATHGWGLGGHNVNLSLEPGETASCTVEVTQPGVYPFYCTEFCSALHLEMTGYLRVRPVEELGK
ncbi:MAG: Sec-dependent nitrous-oxide reductase [Planctomycetes bacterium]|nr:Sec-dependent nitrous-oxide reductase [Planctomycetota bacterium]